ncbi:HAMP domain-containing sensor histidine kinase [Jeotgalibaca caeni]|uniref:HAMP domain-containing sensor histidine kinase n=1 Tax=Jeotgalibaca caeni TaxID=3028623 RepID=UPI00237E00F2|nr:HAMP domain-containing sensor histidine kinase [Jeotgalibaca caeni]MDE1549999.1 HAMP domain-containing sensor histidine kinase [Jeotgalibaca caeni]
MNKKIQSNLWLYFSLVVFALILVSASGIALILLIATYFDIIPKEGGTVYLIIFIALFIALISSGISSIVGKQFLKPLIKLRKSMKQVAQGDFSVQIEEKKAMGEVQELYSDFNLMVRELSGIETMRNDFISNVSHEFKTPLATVQGYVQLLQNKNITDEERDSYYKRIFEGNQQLVTLTDNILKLTKLETQKIGYEEKLFRLDEQVREVLLFLQPQWEEKNLELDLTLEKMMYTGSEELLYQVWLNLFENAIKYNRENGSIKVRLSEKGNQAIITIQDSGIGIREENYKKIFEKFYQEDNSRKTSGNGLGLTLVQKIIELHEGTIEVDSKPQEGTRFRITLPKNN